MIPSDQDKTIGPATAPDQPTPQEAGSTVVDAPRRGDALAATLTLSDGRARPSVETLPLGQVRTRAADGTWSRAGVDSTVSSDPATPPTFPEIPGYEIREELGRGAMGVVYGAWNVGLKRPCALKTILDGAHASPATVARFQIEAEAIAQLRHPNIVAIHAAGEHDGHLYLELEYCEGGTLARRLDGTPWTADLAARLVATLASAVGEAHRRGVVHRDLKPGNVLLLADDTSKVADFGLALSLEADSDLTASGAILGTPSYMAPEQAEGNSRRVGWPADVYALGVMLYELLVGRPPFKASSVLDTMELVRKSEPVAPSRLVSGMPRDLETIVLKCLEKDPARRYATATALADDLGRFLRQEPVVARPVGRVERAWRWCRRNPRVAVLTGLLALALVAGAAASTAFALIARDQARLAQRREREARDQADLADRRLYDVNMVMAQRAHDDGDMNLFRQLLGEQWSSPLGADRRGFEWHY